MNSTVDYYNQNAEKFYQTTVDADMSDVQDRFLQYLPQGALILDAGCGSGRDSLAFLKKGFRVEAFDAAGNMVEKASQLTALNVRLQRFEDVSEQEEFDGIWACASLLHLPMPDLVTALRKLLAALKKTAISTSHLNRAMVKGKKTDVISPTLMKMPCKN